MLCLGNQEKDDSFLIFHSNVDAVDAIIMTKGAYYRLKVRSDDEIIKTWAVNVRTTTEVYLNQLKEALSEQLRCPSKFTLNEIKTNLENFKNTFIVVENDLIWKQYFPEKGIYGRKGKFNLEKISYEEGNGLAFQMIFNSMVSYEHSLFKTAEQASKLEEDLNDAKQLAEKSVKLKADFEKVLYGKFGAILNEKKKYINLLEGKMRGTFHRGSDENEVCELPTSSSTSSMSQITATQSTSKDASHSPLKERINEDEYSADTDVDDVGTDEENERETAALKRKNETKDDNFPPKAKKGAAEPQGASQDIFNDSMEAELKLGYSSSYNFKKGK